MRVVAETFQLIIRTWQESDLAGYAALLGDEEAENLVGFSPGGPKCRAETELWRYQLEQDKLGWSRWAVVYKKTNKLIAYCGFSPYHHDVEVNWRFLPEFRARNLVIEAVEAVVDVGVNQLGFKKLVSFTHPANHDTVDIMKRVGMKFESIQGWGPLSGALL